MDGQLKRPIEDVRAELLADANTQQIAKNLGVELEDYVEEVLYFATHADEEPELRYLEDEKWIDKGITPLSEEEVTAWLSENARADGFGATKEEKRKHKIDALIVAQKSAVAPRVDDTRGQVIATNTIAGKQLVHARTDVQLNLDRMRARGARR